VRHTCTTYGHISNTVWRISSTKIKKAQMALSHIRFFPHTLPLPSTNFTPKLKLNNNRFFFSPSRSSSLTVTAMASNSRKVLVPIADGTEPMEAVIAIDVLRRSGADVTVASAANRLDVQALHGVKIIADASVSDVVNTAFDLVALPVYIPLSLSLHRLAILLLIAFIMLIVKLAKFANSESRFN